MISFLLSLVVTEWEEYYKDTFTPNHNHSIYHVHPSNLCWFLAWQGSEPVWERVWPGWSSSCSSPLFSSTSPLWARSPRRRSTPPRPTVALAGCLAATTATPNPGHRYYGHYRALWTWTHCRCSWTMFQNSALG